MKKDSKKTKKVEKYCICTPHIWKANTDCPIHSVDSKQELRKDGYYKIPLIVGKCPICKSDVERIRPYGHDYCTKKGCPYDTS